MDSKQLHSRGDRAVCPICRDTNRIPPATRRESYYCVVVYVRGLTMEYVRRDMLEGGEVIVLRDDVSLLRGSTQHGVVILRQDDSFLFI